MVATTLSQVVLEDLRVQPSAYFYMTRSEVEPASIVRLLESLGSDGHKKRLQATMGSKPVVNVFAVVRKHERPPAFISHTRVLERRYSLVLVVWSGAVLSVHTTGGGRWSGSIIEKIAHKMDSDIVASALSEGATFQRVRMRSMSPSANSIRTRTLESPKLESTISPQGLSRQIAESVQVQKGLQRISSTPSTARISHSADAMTIEQYVAWFRAQRRLFIKHTKAPTPGHFFDRFASRVDIAKLDSAGVTPSGILLGLDWLTEQILDGTAELQELRAGHWSTISDQHLLIQRLSETGQVKQPTSGRAHEVILPDISGQVILHRNKKSFSVGGKLIDRLGVRDTTTGTRVALSSRIQAEGSLFVTLSDIQYAYAFGQLFRDRSLMTQTSVISDLLVPVPQITDCTSEKGPRNASDTTLEVGSIFHAIESSISKPSDEPILILDDLNDEWADFIGISTSPGSAKISLYHAKHSPNQGTGASPLHDVVSQALKNVGRARVRKEEVVDRKRSFWMGRWAPTGVARLRRGKSVDEAIDSYAVASNQTSLQSRICLVVSFISKKQIEGVLSKLAASPTATPDVKPHESQLIHLLVAFMASVRDANAEPVVYCAP